MIAIIDYGAGNLASVVKAIQHLGADCFVTSAAREVERADKLIIPGVGNFRATQPLANGDLGVALREAVGQHKPLLGICLGLQWMFEGSPAWSHAAEHERIAVTKAVRQYRDLSTRVSHSLRMTS